MSKKRPSVPLYNAKVSEMILHCITVPRAYFSLYGFVSIKSRIIVEFLYFFG